MGSQSWTWLSNFHFTKYTTVRITVCLVFSILWSKKYEDMPGILPFNFLFLPSKILMPVLMERRWCCLWKAWNCQRCSISQDFSCRPGPPWWGHYSVHFSFPPPLKLLAVIPRNTPRKSRDYNCNTGDHLFHGINILKGRVSNEAHNFFKNKS